MKTNIKMRVTPEQSGRVQEICFKNGIGWRLNLKKISHINEPYLAIEPTALFYKSTENNYFSISSLFNEMDADLFIRTNGTCEENQLKDFIQSQNENIDRVNDWTKQFNDVSLKLKKKNEILKKARIKRTNQREELHKLLKQNKIYKEYIELYSQSQISHIKDLEDKIYQLNNTVNLINNLNLEKYISLEEHNKIVDELKKDIDFKNEIIRELEAENIEMGKLVNLHKSELGLMGATKDLSICRVEEQQKEIEKLKAVIEYLESKVK